MHDPSFLRSDRPTKISLADKLGLPIAEMDQLGTFGTKNKIGSYFLPQTPKLFTTIGYGNVTQTVFWTRTFWLKFIDSSAK